MYKLTETGYIQRMTDGAMIPSDEANTDYVNYLKWVEAGNTPAPAFSAEDKLAMDSVAARLWRDGELSRADVQMNKVQDGVTGLGTQKVWRAYRCDLRDWPSSENFPEVKPVAPDAK